MFGQSKEQDRLSKIISIGLQESFEADRQNALEKNEQEHSILISNATENPVQFAENYIKGYTDGLGSTEVLDKMKETKAQKSVLSENYNEHIFSSEFAATQYQRLQKEVEELDKGISILTEIQLVEVKSKHESTN